MPDQTPSTRLASAALGVFDALSPNMLARVRKGTEQGARVSISPRALRELLDALESVRPGIVDLYAESHARLAKERAGR